MQKLMRIAVLSIVFTAIAAASYDSPSDPSPNGVQAFNPDLAPDPTCGTNEEYTQCATHCEATCADPSPICIRSCAPAQCQCVYGYVRNENGECIAANSCPTTTTERYEETTTTAEPVNTTEAPISETNEPETTTTYEPTTQYYNNPSVSADNSYATAPATQTNEQTKEVTEAPTDAPSVEPTYEETTTAPGSDYSPDQTSSGLSTNSDDSQTSSSNTVERSDVALASKDDDVIVVGGSCSQNTCRVGFKCDDSTAVGARCIPFDTRARSSCDQIRCRPGWSCVIAMDGPRCYRNSVLGIADSAPAPSTEAPDVSDHSAVPSNPTESCTDCSSGSLPATCASTTCLTGTRCVENPDGARCEQASEPQVIPGKTCAESACPDMHQCFDTVDGSSCYLIPTDPIEPSTPLKCAQITCNEGETCTDNENEGVCSPSGGEETTVQIPEVVDTLSRSGESSSDCEHTSCPTGEHCAVDFEGKNYCRANDDVPSSVSSNSVSTPVHIPLCSEITCPDNHECFDDAVKGAACWPMRRDVDIVTAAPVIVSDSNNSCSTKSCHQTEVCVEESSGARCVPAQRRGATAPGYRRRF